MEVVTVLSQNLAGGLLSCFEGSGFGTQWSLKFAYTSFCVTDTPISSDILPVALKSECVPVRLQPVYVRCEVALRGQREAASPPPSSRARHETPLLDPKLAAAYAMDTVLLTPFPAK